MSLTIIGLSILKNLISTGGTDMFNPTGLKKSKACREDKPYIVLLQWCLAHEALRKLFHHHVFMLPFFMASNIDIIFNMANGLCQKM